MSKAVKGLLLSGLVFPGLGQLLLKHYLRGAVLMLATIAGLITAIVEATRIVLAILEAINANPALVEIDQIVRAAEKALAEISSPILSTALIVILLSWIISMVDAYWIGSRMDRQAAGSKADPSGEAA